MAALLYLIHEVSFGAKPRLNLPSTSKPQEWGKGATVAKNPQPVQYADYGKRFRSDKYVNVDPRPLQLRHTSKEEIHDFIKANQTSSMKHGYLSNWDSILSITYDDYAVNFDRRIIIYELRQQFTKNLVLSLQEYGTDLLTTDKAYHITGTEEQSVTSKWHTERSIRVTASIFNEFSKNPEPFMKRFWGFEKVPNSTKAMDYGKLHESEAIKALEDHLGCAIVRCGLFVSKNER